MYFSCKADIVLILHFLQWCLDYTACMWLVPELCCANLWDSCCRWCYQRCHLLDIDLSGSFCNFHRTFLLRTAGRRPILRSLFFYQYYTLDILACSFPLQTNHGDRCYTLLTLESTGIFQEYTASMSSILQTQHTNRKDMSHILTDQNHVRNDIVQCRNQYSSLRIFHLRN